MISGLGFQEFLLITIVILVIFGPKKLPEFMRILGRVTREIRRISWEFRSALDINELENDINKGKEIYKSYDESTLRKSGSDFESPQEQSEDDE